MSLFEEPEAEPKGPPPPLPERMRPGGLDEFEGQQDVLGPDSALRKAIEEGRAGSLVLWGPPGVGKTTLALLIARHADFAFEPFSAVLSGVALVREAIARAKERRRREGKGTLLFVDEIHRFNKAQQDAFLPHVEKGDIVLVGATTENPSFSVIPALLSRCRVVPLKPLPAEGIERLVRRALTDPERGLGARELALPDDAMARLVHLAGGDGRRALATLEAAAQGLPDTSEITADAVIEAFQHRVPLHDRAGDQHYDLLSALHKSLRNSDVQASVYWLARFLEADADPLQAARRMVAMAAEDVGLADPMALQVAVAALHAVQFLGLPEGRLPLTEAAVYLAAAPKSNAVYRAIGAAVAEIRDGAQHPVPLHLRNAPTALGRQLGHGEGYLYAHDQTGGVGAMPCLPEGLRDAVFFTPGDKGFEKKIAERMAEADRLRKPASRPGGRADSATSSRASGPRDRLRRGDKP